MIAMKIQKTFAAHFTQLERQAAAFHRQVVGQLLARKWNVKFVAAKTLRLGRKV